MSKRILKIDVLGTMQGDCKMIECHINFDGRICTFWTTTSNYAALVYDKIFIRDGTTKDCAGVLNTTNIFIESGDGQ